jgi:phage baseplate assembly protein W
MASASFLGTGWSFPPRFSPSGIQMMEADQDIRESLRIIVSTQPGERVFNPAFGCDLKSHNFQRLDVGTVTSIQDKIRRAILFFEPRVRMEGIRVARMEEPGGFLQIEVEYVVVATNSRTNMVFPYYLDEGTDLVLLD